MPNLPWVRLDTQFAGNPKLLALTQAGRWRSAFIYIASIAYAGAHGTDGYIPETALPLLQGNKANAIDLVKVGLWEQDVHGWRIHDWTEYQISDEAAVNRSNRARELANRRWHPERLELE
jgi:hypothetical protein